MNRRIAGGSIVERMGPDKTEQVSDRYGRAVRLVLENTGVRFSGRR